MGQPLLGYSFRERRNLLRERFRPRRRPITEEMVAQFDFVENCESTDGKPSVEGFLVKAIENKCEGLMFKVSTFNDIIYYLCSVFSFRYWTE